MKPIAPEHEIGIISGKVSIDHIHLFSSYRPTHNISKIIYWLKGTSPRPPLSEFPHVKKQFWSKHLWAHGYPAVTSGNIIDEMIRQHITQQDGEPVVDDSRFQIDSF